MWAAKVALPMKAKRSHVVVGCSLAWRGCRSDAVVAGEEANWILVDDDVDEEAADFVDLAAGDVRGAAEGVQFAEAEKIGCVHARAKKKQKGEAYL